MSPQGEIGSPSSQWQGSKTERLFLTTQTPRRPSRRNERAQEVPQNSCTQVLPHSFAAECPSTPPGAVALCCLWAGVEGDVHPLKIHDGGLSLLLKGQHFPHRSQPGSEILPILALTLRSHLCTRERPTGSTKVSLFVVPGTENSPSPIRQRPPSRGKKSL